LLVGKNFKNADRNKDAVKLGACIEKNLGDFADDSDTNPNWGSAYDNMKANRLMQWNYFSSKGN
jgi:hypothetical protein